MSDRYVDPELAGMLGTFRTEAFGADTLPGIRAEPRPLPPLRPFVGLAERRVPGAQGAPDVRVLALSPVAVVGPLPVLLWIHGGGYVSGAAESVVPFLAEAAVRLRCLALSVDYRLAPEHPHPAALDDCAAVLRAVRADPDRFGVDPARIAIGGDSAGGGLAAALAIRDRDEGAPPLRFQALVYPMLDDRTVVQERDPGTGRFVWTRESNRFGWSSYLGREPGGPDVPPTAAPARLVDATGLPPTFVSVGDLDLFREEDVAYAGLLSRAGVPVTLHVLAGAYHGFRRLPAALTRAHDAELLDLLAAALARP